MKAIDLNCDMGESFGAYRLGNDSEVLKFVSSANIACGYHAGDHNTMMETVKEAKNREVNIGAHPGFPDLQGFGRREMLLRPDEVYNLVLYQLGAISSFVKVANTRLIHIKPHGALYNMAAADRATADAVAAAAADFDRNLVVFGLSGSQLITAALEKGLRAANEVFADRTYRSDGLLMPRSERNSVIYDSDLVIKQALRMAKEGKVTTADGTELNVAADTICIHGDNPEALEFAKILSAAFSKESISLRRSWDDL
ncbi:5-oxoprolinase subunit PxpA [Bacillus sp. FJAT-27445]|uniref:5-oxoprolinase subunit PxpA n=1 Tax=Bacillus sp. FJAT-27445 TaxID=1679166 RepID=UPI000A6140B9|nr:5-oxoprolinase subunit PxpA [Bacillus sp. FJAT-27445]